MAPHYLQVPSVLFNICPLARLAREETRATREAFVSSCMVDTGDVLDALYTGRGVAATTCTNPQPLPRFYGGASRPAPRPDVLFSLWRITTAVRWSLDEGRVRTRTAGVCHGSGFLARTRGCTQPSLASVDGMGACGRRKGARVSSMGVEEVMWV